jgi:hypothetical protein
MPDRDWTSLPNDEVFAHFRNPAAPEDREAARAEIERRDRERRAGRIQGRVSEPAPMPVVVRNFDMPFGDMVVFILKWSVAAIPALLILLIVGSCAGAMLAGIGMGLGK